MHVIRVSMYTITLSMTIRFALACLSRVFYGVTIGGGKPLSRALARPPARPSLLLLWRRWPHGLRAPLTLVCGVVCTGKSNLMDAISFVLGVKVNHLRGAAMKDVIYAGDGKARAANARASVELVCMRGTLDGAQSSVSEEVRFRRSVNAKGVSEYRVDGNLVTWDEYEVKLRTLNVLVKAKNFLVFQGDVEGTRSAVTTPLLMYYFLLHYSHHSQFLTAHCVAAQQLRPSRLQISPRCWRRFLAPLR